MRAPKGSPSEQKSQTIIDTARRALKIESKAVADLVDRVDESFVNVVHHIDQCQHLIITGMGKSGLIGNKIAATFSSLGLPTLFLHAAEASHGDLGMIVENDTVISYSNLRVGGDKIPANYLDRVGESLFEGYISLQSEGHPVEFKNIKIKNLD